ncbi:MAG: GTPase HflX [Treponema sp.]|nr:GTPase HflX [Treponema sp.]
MTEKLHDTTERRKRALLVSLNDEKAGPEGFPADLHPGRELRGLAESLELEIAGHEVIRIRERQAKFGMGTGKAQELADKAAELEADCLVFDWETGPSQQRNWETLTGIPLIDRQELIIRIFAERALTREATLQVELAGLNYRLPRLAHKYIDLSRQRGGRYGTKGSGETMLETDRRQIEQRIHQLEKEIKEVVKQRQVQRRQRERQQIPVCALVGYTNAGKSSLLNALTGAAVLVEDKLFATLDATTRRFEPEPGAPVLLTDTVGFIRHLPHSLVKAFRSTLEEASHANLLLHVVDSADPEIDECFQTTISVLKELGAGDIPILTILNKADRLESDEVESILSGGRFPDCIAVSAVDGSGLKELKALIAEKLGERSPAWRQPAWQKAEWFEGQGEESEAADGRTSTADSEAAVW